MLRFFPARFWSPRAWRTWMSYLKWRMETYGVYYPAGQFNKEAFSSLLRQMPRYLQWIRQMDTIRKKSPTLRT